MDRLRPMAASIAISNRYDIRMKDSHRFKHEIYEKREVYVLSSKIDLTSVTFFKDISIPLAPLSCSSKRLPLVLQSHKMSV
jgi:hypothetical protein